MELVCPAGTLPSLKAAVDHGADAVYLGFRDETNARHFPGLNFDEETALLTRTSVAARCSSPSTPTCAHDWCRWQDAVDWATGLGADALILADIALLDYAQEHHSKLPRHLSGAGLATNHEALRFYSERFGIRRAVLQHVLSLAQLRQVSAKIPLPLEVFGFGRLCIMAEGRCHLSSYYLTGDSPNLNGVCSPAWAVRWEQTPDALESRLNGVLIDRYRPDEKAGYPTLCKGRFQVAGHTYHALEEPTSLNTLELLPDLHAAGIRAIKIEGRQRSPAYVAQGTRVWRQALDRLLAQPATFAAREKSGCARWRNYRRARRPRLVPATVPGSNGSNGSFGELMRGI